MTIRDYSATASDNTSVAGIGLSDAMLANALDNAIRALMADSANFLLDIAKPTSTTGSGNIYALSTGGTVSTYEDKIRLAFRASFTNTGPCTINIDVLGAVDLKVYSSTGIGDPASGQIQSGGVYDIIYVAALGDFIILNPTPIDSLENVAEDLTPQLGGALDTNGFSVHWSKGADVASANDLPLLNDGNSVDVIGNNPITSIDLINNIIPVGSIYNLRFASSLTMAHDPTNLILLGNAGVEFRGGDSATFIKYQSNGWRMISFSGVSPTGYWEVGTSTRYSYISPADVKAAIDALSPISAQSYESAGQTITSAGALTLAHGLASKPKIINYYLRCLTAEAGYSVGDELHDILGVRDTNTTQSRGMAVVVDATNINIRFSSTTSVFANMNFTTGASTPLTNANWELYVQAWS